MSKAYIILNIVTMFVWVLGIGVTAYGAWLTYKPAGYIVGGCLLMLWAYLVSVKPNKEGKI